MTTKRLAVMALALALAADAAWPAKGRAAPVSGERRVLVLLVNFTDDRSEPLTVEEARQVLLDGPDGLTAFYEEVSHGALHVTGEVRGWFNLPIPCDPAEKIFPAAVKLPVSFAGFDDLILYHPYVLGCLNSGPSSSGGSLRIETREGVFYMPVILMPHGYPPGALWHELGHDLGLRHATSKDCPEGMIDGTCKQPDLEHGDLFDMMGDNEGYPCAAHLEQLGWLEPMPPTPNTCQTLEAIERGGSSAIEFPAWDVKTCTYTYYLEHRAPIGFDDFITSPRFPSSVTRGILVHLGTCSGPTSLLALAGVTGTFGEIGPGEAGFFDGKQPFLVSVESGDEERVKVCLRRFALYAAASRAGTSGRFMADGEVGLTGDVSPGGPWSVRLALVENGVPSTLRETTIPAIKCHSALKCAGRTRDRQVGLSLRKTSEPGTWEFRLKAKRSFGVSLPAGDPVLRLELCPASDPNGCIWGNFRFTSDGTTLAYEP